MKDLFKENYNEINKLLNNKESKIEIYYYPEKILDNPDNSKVLSDILSRTGEKNLMVSEPNSGKTYSLLKEANKLDRITVFSVPLRALAEQIAETYKALNITLVVGGVNVDEIDICKCKILVVVYDKLEEVLSTFKNEIDNLIIDEAQELVLATSYRKRLEHIEKSFSKIVMTSGKACDILNVLYLTGTPNALMYLPFNNVFLFEKQVKDDLADSFYIYKTSNLEDGLASKLIQNEDNRIKTLVMLNDKEELRENIIHKIENKIKEKGKNIKVSKIASDTKDFKIDEEGNRIFTNEMYNDILKYNSLPDSEMFFSTCLIESGVNITNLKNGKFEELELIYVIRGLSDCVLDNIIQFANRARKKFFRFSIIIHDAEVKEEDELMKIPFRPFLELVDNYYDRLMRRKECLEEGVRYYKFKKGYTDTQIIHEIKTELNQTTIDRKIASLDGSFSINDDLEIVVDYKKFFRFVYILYNQQFYKQPELLGQFFSKPFQVEEIEKIDFSKIVVAEEDEINKIWEEIKTNKNILCPSSTIDEDKRKVNREKFEKISQNFTYKLREYYNLVELGKTEEEAIDIVIGSSKTKITRIKNQLVLEDLKKMTTSDYVSLYSYLIGYTPDKIIDLKKQYPLVYKLKKTSYIDYFEKCVHRNFNLEKMIKYIVEGNSANAFLEMEQYILTNNKYINKEDAVSFDDKIQYYIIENIGKYENKHKSYLTKKKIDAITEKVNKEFNKNYDRSYMAKALNNIFKIGEKGRFNGLRTE